MEITQCIINKLRNLSKRDKVKFFSSCIHRYIKLYKLFDNENDINKMIPSIPKGFGYCHLLKILNFIDNDLEKSNKKQIEQQIKFGEQFIVDTELYGNSTNNVISQIIAEAIVEILEFYIYDEKENITYFIDNIFEIINQLKSDEFLRAHPNGSCQENEKYLNNFYQNELQIENESIKMIERKDYDKLKDIIQNHSWG